MVSLYTTKSQNIRKSIFLIASFLIFVVAIGWLISYTTKNDLFWIIAVIYATSTSLIGYFYSDKIILGMFNAQPITIDNNPELYRIVENLAITVGAPMPKIYIIQEAAPNAFATGRNPKKAVIAMTSGLIERLDRSELEGVISHELSHIVNRDTLISTLVVILVAIVAMISNLFLHSLRFSNKRDDKRGGNLLFILAIIGAILAPLVAILIQLAISRKREFLADANGALITRYPDGLINALTKISSNQNIIRKISNHTNHLWFEDPVKGKARASWFHKLFMTHPPVEDRIKALMGTKS